MSKENDKDVENGIILSPTGSRPTDFGSIVRTLLIIRHWITNTRSKRKRDTTVDDDNVRRVFDPAFVKDDTLINKEIIYKRIWKWSFEYTSTFFYLWTFIIFIGCFYNLVMIVVMVFEEVHNNFYQRWIQFNIAFDIIFIIDLIILTRREFIDDGVSIKSVTEMIKHRIKTKSFILDVICIIPFDLLLLIKPGMAFTRLNRLLKCYRIGDFNALTEIRTSFPNLFRIVKLIFTCFIIFHWNGCLYFFLSVMYRFETAKYDDWIFSYDKIPNPVIVICDVFDYRSDDYCSTDIIVPLRELSMENMTEWDKNVNSAMNYWREYSKPMEFSNLTKQYGLSFYWSALTLVTLGEQPWPNTTFQNSFEIGDTLLGLVIFAVIVGDVGNMVSSMNLKKSQFEEVLDGCKSYMIYRKVGVLLQEKAVEYFGYMWTHGGAQVDENELAEFLPPRLYGQLAVHIHMETLRKVKLFEDCEPNLLFELILKLDPRVYSPMDYICRKGDVGTEMYIVKRGAVQVVNEDGTKNGNKRTANVRSAGYSDLYVLSKEDLWAALREYPDAKISLMKKGKDILAKDNMLDENGIDEDEFISDAPIEEQMRYYQQCINKLEEDMAKAEQTIRNSTLQRKKRIFELEVESEESFKQLDQIKIDTCEINQ